MALPRILIVWLFLNKNCEVCRFNLKNKYGNTMYHVSENTVQREAQGSVIVYGDCYLINCVAWVQFTKIQEIEQYLLEEMDWE